MKIKKLYILTSSLFLLTGCSKAYQYFNWGQKSYCYVAFINSINGEQIFEKQMTYYTTEGKDNIKKQLEAAIDKYFNDKDIYNWYTFDNYYIKYDNAVFDFEANSMIDYFKNSEALRVSKPSGIFKTSKTYLDIICKYNPKEFNISYEGVDSEFTKDFPTTYTYETNFSLPTPTREDYSFEGWYIDNNKVESIPKNSPSDITLTARWSEKVLTINYENVLDEYNPNPETHLYTNGVLTLKPMLENPHYSFKGWLVNGEKVETIDPHDYADQIVTITADIDYVVYKATYVVAGEVFIEKEYTLLNFDQYEEPEVPYKEHYIGSWNGSVTELKNYAIYANYTEDRTPHSITYNGVDGLTNPNPTSFTYFDDEIVLIDLPSNEKIEFKGWKLNDEYITTIDPKLYDEDIVLVADIVIKEYKIELYVENVLFNTITFNYTNINSVTLPDVPSKEHYVGSWDITSIVELKNYVINATYSPEQYTIKIFTNISGYEVEDITVSYGTTFKEACESISYTNKYITNVYSDSSKTIKVDMDDLVFSDISLYFEWAEIYKISKASDWSQVVEHPSATFEMTNDINFFGEAITITNDFSGTFDGKGYSIKNASNVNASCPSVYGVFANNTGIIKNITFDTCTFSVTEESNSTIGYIGLVSGINKGTIENVHLVKCPINIVLSDNCGRVGNDYTGYSYAGGLVGGNEGIISNSSLNVDTKLTFKATMAYRFNMNIDATFRSWFGFGGIAGVNRNQINNVENNGSIDFVQASISEVRADGYSRLFAWVHFPLRVGGIAGVNAENSSIVSSLNASSISVNHVFVAQRNSFPYNDVGGIAGNNSGKIDNCASNEQSKIAVKATGDCQVGGLFGTNTFTGEVKASYSTSKFELGSGEALLLGGLGGANEGKVSYCYAVVKSIKSLNTTDYDNGYFSSLIGEVRNGSSNMFLIGEINLEEEFPLLKGRSFANIGTTAILTEINVYCPDQDTAITKNEGVTHLESETLLLELFDSFGFYDIGFAKVDDSFPAISNIGLIVE